MERQRLVIKPPPIESLLNIGIGDSLWPKDIQNNPAIKTQAEMRRNLHAGFDWLFGQIPFATIEIAEAVNSGKIDPEKIANIYGLLADFLDADPRHRRLVLYLPFELLPSKRWQPVSNRLLISSNRLVGSYMCCWYNSLKDKDVRANFFDGNILETELSPNGQIMVCKAAHLIPKLVEKGLVTITTVLELMARGDEVLRSSIADTLPVLVDMSLLHINECDRILDLYNFPLPADKKRMVSRVDKRDNGPEWLDKLSFDSEFELNKIDMRAVTDQSRGMPVLRIAWERQESIDRLIEKYADKISSMLIDGSLASNDTSNFLTTITNNVACLAVINGIRKAVELIAKNNPTRARDILMIYEDSILKLWLEDMPGMKDVIMSMLSRIARLSVIDVIYLEKFGIHLPRLDYPVSDIKNIIGIEVGDIASAIESIDNDPDISQIIYPVVIFFGSRLKGYAKINADLDCAIFVRPGVQVDRRPEIQRILRKIFSNKNIDGKIVEFWLVQEGDNLKVRDFSDPDILLADSMWMHLLFAGAWLGKEDVINEFYTKLLSGFIYSKGKKLMVTMDARRVWLSEMEREVLQYRLMHKGYKRFYPEQGGISTEHSERLDSQSSFWDSGYRRIATCLFLTRVFLPQL